MPFGIKSARSVMQALMDSILGGLSYDILLCYFDDLTIIARGFNQMVHRMVLVFDRLREANLTLSPTKSRFFQRSIIMFGYKLTGSHIEVDPKKIESVSKFATPENITQVRGFLGLTGYFRRFIKDY